MAVKKKAKGGKHHGKGHGHGASQSSPTSTSAGDDAFAPSTSTQLRYGFISAVHLAVLQEFLDSVLHYAQSLLHDTKHYFLTHALPAIKEAMPASLQEAAEKAAALGHELWGLAGIHYERLKKLLFHFLGESRAYGEILLSDASQFAFKFAAKSQVAAKKMANLVFQLGALAVFLAVDTSLRFTFSFLSLGGASLLFCFWCLVFGLASFMGWLAFSALFVLMAGWTFVVNFWVPLVLLGCICVYAIFQCGLVLASCGVAAVAGTAYAFKCPKLCMLTIVLFTSVASFRALGLVRVLLCLLLSAITLEVLTLITSPHEDSPYSNPWKSSSRHSTGDRNTSRDGPTWSGQWSFNGRFSQSASAERGSEDSQETQDREDEEESSSGGAGSKDVSPEMVARREITRIIRCKHHYAVLQLEMYAAVDAVELKKEYRKKAILVHPDKNSGNEKRAREAFQSLQCAFEVLSEPEKKKEYDEELRHKMFIEMLKNRGKESAQNPASTSGVSRSSSSTSTGEATGPEGSIRIGCSNCGESHIWLSTPRRKAQARWCQECKVYHAAKEGEGWMEQHPVPALFGLLSTNGPVQAFTCSDGKVYDVTEWVDCEGFRCPVNTHKPTFSYKPRTVPTTPLRSKGSGSKGSSAHGATMPDGFAQGADVPENLSEEEMLDFLAQAVNAGLLDAETLLEALKKGAQAEAEESQPKKSKPNARRRGKGKGHH